VIRPGRALGETAGVDLHRFLLAEPAAQGPARHHALGFLRAAGARISERRLEPDRIFVRDGKLASLGRRHRRMDLALALRRGGSRREVALRVARDL